MSMCVCASTDREKELALYTDIQGAEIQTRHKCMHISLLLLSLPPSFPTPIRLRRASSFSLSLLACSSARFSASAFIKSPRRKYLVPPGALPQPLLLPPLAPAFGGLCKGLWVRWREGREGRERWEGGRESRGRERCMYVRTSSREFLLLFPGQLRLDGLHAGVAVDLVRGGVRCM